MKYKPKNFLKIFESHGVAFTGERGDQLYGYCPFSDKDNKFYVNKKNGLWDSKSAGLSGNISKFLELRAKNYEENLKGNWVRQLAENRQMPRSAFEGIGLGWDGKAFTIPIRDFDGKMVDIRRYDIRSKMMRSTAGCRVGLMGAERLKAHPTDRVFVCEGEWDALALKWLLRVVNEPGVVVAVPGAGTFKPEWGTWLRGRVVHTLYDFDSAGRRGEELVLKKLKDQVQALTFVHWPDEVPVGFDTRDWVVYGCTLRNTPDVCWERLQRRFKTKPKWDVAVGKITIRRRKGEAPSRWKIPPTLAQVHDVFNKWLFLKTNDVINVMLATIVSQRIEGSPVWMFLVGPPGSAKTAMVSSLLQGIDMIYGTSTLTAPALISGANFSGVGDPSLIPKLNEKVLVVKDFTSILSLPDREQKEIFGILRDAYDGHCGKIFGNGVVRNYSSHFTILAATTPRIYDLSDQHAALGERFLKFLVGDNLHHESENQVIRRAIENADRETAMHEEIQDAVKAFLERTTADYKPARMPGHILDRIIALVKFGARMRGSVSRDVFRNDIVTSRPMAEVGTRLGQQLSKLARGLATIQGKPEVGDDEYRLIKKTMLDTISQRNEDVLRSLITAMGGSDVLQPISLREIANRTHYPFETIRRLAQDLAALQIIKRQGIGVKSEWTLSDYVKREIQQAQLYTAEELAQQPARRIRLRKSKKHEYHRYIRVPMGPVQVSSQNGKVTITNLPTTKGTPPPQSHGKRVITLPEDTTPAAPTPILSIVSRKENV